MGVDRSSLAVQALLEAARGPVAPARARVAATPNDARRVPNAGVAPTIDGQRSVSTGRAMSGDPSIPTLDQLTTMPSTLKWSSHK